MTLHGPIRRTSPTSIPGTELVNVSFHSSHHCNCGGRAVLPQVRSQTHTSVCRPPRSIECSWCSTFVPHLWTTTFHVRSDNIPRFLMGHIKFRSATPTPATSTAESALSELSSLMSTVIIPWELILGAKICSALGRRS